MHSFVKHFSNDSRTNNMSFYNVAYFNRWLLVFCSLVAVELAAAIQHKLFIESESSGGCDSIKEQYWKLIQWFYGMVNIVFVNSIVDSKANIFHIRQQNTFVKEISERCNCTVKYQVVDIGFEPANVPYVDTFTWQGDRFEKRPTQSTKIIYNRRKRDAAESFQPENDRAWTIRGDELDFGVLVLVEKISILDKYLVGSPRSPFDFPRQMFVISITNIHEPQFEETSIKTLTRLWLDYGIANVILITPCRSDPEIIRTYFPFDPVQHGGTTTWGAVRSYKLDEIDYKGIEMFTKFRNLHGFPLRVSLFRRYPTSLQARELPEVFRSSYLMKDSWRAAGYGGVYGIMLSNVAKSLNFAPVVVTPIGIDFGYRASNGTFFGTIGAVLYRETYASFNGRFMDNYGTNEIEYMFPYFFDKLCIIAPKALKIPEWMAIFKCFSITVWLSLLLVNCICGWFWFLLKRSNTKYLNDKKMKERKRGSSINRFSNIFIEMWIIMLSSPSTNLPTGYKERIFMATCLFSNIIFAGSFQGSLTTSYSTDTYYKDINTLEELNESGLPIGTSSGSLRNIFGTQNSGGPVVRALAAKYFLLNSTRPTIKRTAFERGICCIERLTDISVIIADHYEKPDGSVLLHVIKQCPRSYYMAFIVKRGYPLLPTFSDYISRVFEGGIVELWYNHIEYAIITHRRYHRLAKSEDAQAFTMVDMQTAFYILFIGLFIGTFVFIGELIVYRRRKQPETEYFEFVH